MILQYANNATSALKNPINTMATSMTLLTGGGAAFPLITSGQAFFVTLMDAATQLIIEIVECTAISGDTLTIVRAQQNTVALSWPAGSIVSQLLTAGDMNNFIQATTVQSGYLNFAVGTGTANSTLATLASLLTTIPDGMPLTIEAVGPNTGAMTLTLTLGTTVTGSFSVVKYGNVPLIAGDVPAAKYPMELVWSSTFNAFVLNNPSVVIPPQIQSIGASVASNALTVTYAGGNLSFRSSSSGSGSIVTVNVGAQSLTIPSGATLGTVSGVQSQLVLLEVYNGGSPVLGVVNIAGGVNLDETTNCTTTAISSSSNSATAIYTAAAVSGSPFRVIGTVISTQSTAGTWATSVTTVQGAGGQALAAMQSLGYGQTWQNVTSSRANATTYYNTTSRPILVSVTTGTGSTTAHYIYVNGVTAQQAATNPNSTTAWVSAIVPPGASYSTSNNGTMGYWAELR